MKNTIKTLITIIAMLVLSTATLHAQTSPYVVDNETVIVTKNTSAFVQTENVISTFLEFIKKNGLVSGTLSCKSSHASADIDVSNINEGKYSQMGARITLDVKYENGVNKITAKCNQIDIYFPLTDIKYSYNPATNYPVSTIYDAKNTRISQEDAKETFIQLTKYMNKITSNICTEAAKN